MVTDAPKYISTIKAMLSKNASFVFLSSVVLGDRLEAKKVGMINSYLEDVNYDGEVENPVFILFKPDDMGRFRLFYEGEKKKGRTLKDDYDYSGHVVLVYSFPYKKDYQLFLEGKYCEMSEEYRKALPPPERVIMNTPEYEGVEPGYIERPGAWSVLNKNGCIYKDWMDTIGELPGNGDEYYPKPLFSKEKLDFEEYIKTK